MKIGSVNKTKNTVTYSSFNASKEGINKKDNRVYFNFINSIRSPHSRKTYEFIIKKYMHIALDEKSKNVVSFRITKGNVHDSKKFCSLVKEAAQSYNIDMVHADKAHDNRRSFNLLDDLNIEPAINIRKNASIKTKGCPLRREEVLLIKKLRYDGWKQLKDTGRR